MEYVVLDKKQKIFRNVAFVLPLIVLFAMIVFALSFGYAADNNNAVVTEVVDAVMKIVQIVAVAVGAIFVLVGIVKFAMAHANEDGPAQQKAILMLAAGIVLVVVGILIVPNLSVSDWITSVADS